MDCAGCSADCGEFVRWWPGRCSRESRFRCGVMPKTKTNPVGKNQWEGDEGGEGGSGTRARDPKEGHGPNAKPCWHKKPEDHFNGLPAHCLIYEVHMHFSPSLF
uniref:Uncharacterized protein n=1 Tax=Vitis vinifera TaxID=29760 RepID=A5ASI2_VITVI|nr:hypothetical protein VITISV_040049 [Vitis vinifera]